MVDRELENLQARQNRLRGELRDPVALAEIADRKPQKTNCRNGSRPVRLGGKEIKTTYTPKTALAAARVPEKYRRYRLCEISFRTKPESNGLLDWSRGGFFLGGINGQGKSSWAAAAIRSRFDPRHHATLARIEERYVGEGRYENGIYIQPEKEPLWVIPFYAARWWYSPDLVAWIQNAEIDKHQNREYLISELLKPEIMVWDDFGKERWTEWTSEIVNTVFERRTAENKCLIVTSNMKIEEIARNRDVAISSRLKALVEVFLPVKDRRVTG